MRRPMGHVLQRDGRMSVSEPDPCAVWSAIQKLVSQDYDLAVALRDCILQPVMREALYELAPDETSRWKLHSAQCKAEAEILRVIKRREAAANQPPSH